MMAAVTASLRRNSTVFPLPVLNSSVAAKGSATCEAAGQSMVLKLYGKSVVNSRAPAANTP